MAKLVPIRGVRYNNELIKDLAEVITPPYDVISEDEQESYYQKSPYNIIRLEYGKSRPEDNEQKNKYIRAAQTFHLWLEEGVLKQDQEETIYLYEQEYTNQGQSLVRTGLIAGVKVEPYSKKVILPHEETLTKPKADRLNLLRHCHANFSPIFGLYADKNKKLPALWKELKNHSPEVEFTDESGQSHRLWLITERSLQLQIIDFFKHLRIFIADGHHRYETALKFAEEMHAQGFSGFDYVLMTLVNLYDPGLIILPAHRIISNLKHFVPQELNNNLRENFDLLEYNKQKEPADFLQELKRQGENAVVFGLYTDGNYYLLRLKQEKPVSEQRLDVTIFQEFVLEKALGITERQRREGGYLTYSRDAAKAISEVDSGKKQAVFLLNPTTVKQVTDAAEEGRKMPQKSTYFYPKLCTGLVINKLD